MLERAFTSLAYQLVDSELEVTRRYWRGEVFKLPPEIVSDPRSMREILGEWPDWRSTPPQTDKHPSE